MKILFHNYTNSLSTEPLYLHNALVKSGINSVLWSNKQISAYDMFDTHKPDVFVTHFQVFTYDIMNYLKNNNNCQIVMNVTGASQSQLESIEKTFSEFSFKCPFIFTNSFDPIPKSKLNLVTMYPASDIFNLDYMQSKDFTIPEAIISDKFDEKVQNYIANKEVFHLLYINGNELDSNFDIRVSVQSLPQIYRLYKKITLIADNDICCSQVFLDMNLNCNEVEIQSANPNGFKKMLSEMFVESDNENIQQEIKNQIKARHTPFHRAARFMKYLGNNDAMRQIDNVKSQLPELLKGL